MLPAEEDQLAKALTEIAESARAYDYSPSSCYVVNRTQNLDLEINRARLVDSDRSEMRLRVRLDYFWTYPGAIRPRDRSPIGRMLRQTVNEVRISPWCPRTTEVLCRQ